ncbi:MAG: MFS transporter [Pseudomonadota bacterium]
MPTNPERRSALIAWSLYDWATSAYAALIQTFLFPAYFARALAPDAATGTVWWGNAMGLAGLAIAVLAPILGALADRGGHRRLFLALLTLINVLATAALWTVRPDADFALRALVLAGVGTVALELAFVFYNAQLADLAAPERIGRWSGWAWGLGYLGGLACLVLALLGFVQATPPPFGLDPAAAEPVRATFLLAAVWIAVFALPLLLMVPDPARARSDAPAGRVLRMAFTDLGRSLRGLLHDASMLRFFAGRLLLIDGLTTVFAFGGLFAAGTFGFDERAVLLFAIVLNLTSAVGAVAFAWLDDRLGARSAMLWSLVGLLITGTALLLAPSAGAFWVWGALLGIFVGPAQAASRSYLARMAPAGQRNELFGLMAFSGKATTFLGPFLVAALTTASGSQRVGLGVVLVMFAGALLLTVGVASDRRAPQER